MFMNVFHLKILDNWLLDKSKFFLYEETEKSKDFFPDFGCIVQRTFKNAFENGTKKYVTDLINLH